MHTDTCNYNTLLGSRRKVNIIVVNVMLKFIHNDFLYVNNFFNVYDD